MKSIMKRLSTSFYEEGHPNNNKKKMSSDTGSVPNSKTTNGWNYCLHTAQMKQIS